MKHPLAALRLGVVLLFLVGVLSPIATTGAGAQDLTCDDFNSERAAQAVLDADPDMAETLDPDGDGVACNHEEDATDDGSADSTDDSTDDSSDDGSADGGDADAYLADVTDQAAAWAEQFATLEDLDPISGGLSDAEIDDVVAIIEEFAAAPDTAAEFEAPEGLEDVQSAFEDLADGYAEIASTFADWLDTEAGSAEEADAEDAYNEALDAAIALDEDFNAAVEDAGGSAGDDSTDDGADDSTDDGSDDGSADGGDVDAYIADVTDQVDAWADQFATLEDLDPISGGLSEDEVDEIVAIIEEFAAAPDTAAEFEAPEGAEDVQAAFEDLADGYAEVAGTFADWLDTEAGSPEEADAEDLYVEAVDAIADLQDEFDAAVEDAGGSSSGDDATDDSSDDSADDSTDDATDDGTEDDGSDDGSGTDADTEAYLEDVRDHSDEIIAGGERLIEILSAEEVTDQDRDDLAAILELWADAPDQAASLDVPEGMEDLQAAYEDLADAYATVGENFTAWLDTEPESAESDEAWEEFTGSLTDAITLAEEFDALLTEAGG